MNKPIENADAFYQYNHKEGYYSFGVGTAMIFLVIVIVSGGFLGTLLYVNQSRVLIEASQSIPDVTRFPRQASDTVIMPLQPPVPDY